MSRALLITYELRNMLTHDYTPLFNEIKNSPKWWHYLPNTWIIISEEDAIAWQRKLVPLTVVGDNLLIIEVRRNSGGWLPKEAWDWINSNISF